MNLEKKKSLAIRTLGIGKDRIKFIKSRIDEIKEALTKKDIKQLVADGAIKIIDIKGKKKVKKKKVKIKD
jgi:ribosomal protein L19E